MRSPLAIDNSMPNVLPRHFNDHTPEEAAIRDRFHALERMRRKFVLGSYDVEVVAAGFIQPHFLNVGPHEHAYFEVCYVHDGGGVFGAGEREFNVSVHDLFIARPGVRHSIRAAAGGNIGLYFWGFSIVPRAGRKAQVAEVDPEIPLGELVEAFRSSEHAVSSKCNAFRRVLDMLDDEMREAQPGYTFAIDALLAKLVLDTLRTARGQISSEELNLEDADSPAAVVNAAVRFIRANYARTIELKDVADAVCLSRRHLARLFRQQMNTSVVGYLTALRMDVARQLLLDPRLPIKQIAQMVGFQHVHYFSTLFRRSVGITPARFRERRGTEYDDERVRESIRLLHESWKHGRPTI